MRALVLAAGFVLLASAPAGAQILTTSTTSPPVPTTVTPTTAPPTTAPPSTTATTVRATPIPRPTTPTTRRPGTTTTATTVATTSTAPAFVPPQGTPDTAPPTTVALPKKEPGKAVLPILVVLSVGGFALALLIVAAQFVATRPRKGRPGRA